MTVQERLEEEANNLRTIRDELNVQLNLAKLEARELWDDLEKDWAHAEGRLKVLGEASQDSAEEVGDAIGVVFEKLRDGYEKLKKLV